MHITRYTDYSLRVLIYLGLKRHELVTIKEIADCYRISKNHLVKVVYELNRRGYIETIRGKGGGIRLRVRPDALPLGDFVRETEQDLALVECFAATDACRISRPCRLKGVLRDALEAFFDHLNQYTLADLIEPEQDLGLALGIRPFARSYHVSDKRN
ncbi:MAG: Rrf2 family transcriptional regulator [Pseudomonadota bacterium]|nr:Rrf2 family transcriptional regulator [Pseudomonadota bacterium]